MNTEKEEIEFNELEKEHLKTMVSCMNTLTKLGYVNQYKATLAGLLSLASGKVFQPHEIRVPRFYRFEGESNPSDGAILYAIETNDGEKGTLVDGYGTTSDQHVSNFMNNVTIEKKEESPVTEIQNEVSEKTEHVSWIAEAVGQINTDFPLSGGEQNNDR